MSSRQRGRDPSRGPLGRLFLRGGLWALAARVLAVGAGLATQVFLARLLEPQQMGAYFLAQSIVVVSSLVGQLGLNRSLVRSVAEAMGREDRSRARSAVVKSLQLALISSGVIAAVYAMGLGDVIARRVFDSSILGSVTLVIAAWIALMGLQNVVAEAHRGFHRIGRASFFGGTLTSLMTAGALGVLFVLHGSEDFGRILWITVAATGANLLVSLAFVTRQVAGAPADPSVRMRGLLAGTLAIAVANVSHAAMGQFDLWIVGSGLSHDEVALYGAAKRLIRLISLPLVIMNLVVPPVIASLNARDEKARLERALRGAVTLAGLPSLLVIIAMIAASGEILELVYGEFYRAGATLLVILSVERLLFVWVGPCSLVLMMTGKDRQMLTITLFCGAVTVVAALVGLRVAGAVGIAAGTASGAMLRDLLMWRAARDASGVRTHVDLLHLGAMVEPLRRALGVSPRGGGRGETRGGPDQGP